MSGFVFDKQNKLNMINILIKFKKLTTKTTLQNYQTFGNAYVLCIVKLTVLPNLFLFVYYQILGIVQFILYSLQVLSRLFTYRFLPISHKTNNTNFLFL